MLYTQSSHLIFIDGMSRDLDLKCHEYADDTTLIHKVSNPTASSVIINNQLKIFSAWAIHWCLIFNTIKTHFMYITYKHQQPRITPILFDNKIISEVSSHVNLGETITNDRILY